MKQKITDFLVLILLVLTAMLAASCEDPISDIPDYYTMEIDGRLDTTTEGLYKLKLNSGQYSAQTIHRITGKLLNNGEEPNPPQLVNWESSHYWTIESDTAYSYIRRVINFSGQWVNVDTIYVTGFQGTIVPTINEFCYSGTDGEINTVIAPVDEMVGDTMTVKATFKDIEKIIKIVLE